MKTDTDGNLGKNSVGKNTNDYVLGSSMKGFEKLGVSYSDFVDNYNKQRLCTKAKLADYHIWKKQLIEATEQNIESDPRIDVAFLFIAKYQVSGLNIDTICGDVLRLIADSDIKSLSPERQNLLYACIDNYVPGILLPKEYNEFRPRALNFPKEKLDRLNSILLEYDMQNE